MKAFFYLVLPQRCIHGRLIKLS